MSQFGMADETARGESVRSPLSPADARAAFVLDSPDIKIELAAAEPEVIDPVAIAFGSDGALWVVEMRDYPYGPRPGSGELPQSRIRRLVDVDGDGRFESATTFAENLLFPTGILPWRDGLLVTLAGEIVFLPDRNQDGTADGRETWFTGFTQENSQLRANHPTFGPDGRIYVANGLRGGTIVTARTEWESHGKSVALAGFDFCFDPITGAATSVSGHGQFGLCFDEAGNRFVCSNRHPAQHVVMEDEAIRRNPFLAVKGVVQDVAAPAESSKLYPISRAWTTSTLHANQFTAACGVQIARGDALPPEYRGNVFTCDPTGNLVHRERLRPAGATFAGEPVAENREFLASPDPWFRPVNLANGPDGSLYVVDMYRAVIEHPDWMPAELKTRRDLLDGNDRGRIWRVTAARPDARAARPAMPLDRLSTPNLVTLLEHPDGWHRDTAHRLLTERDPGAVLEALQSHWKQNSLSQDRLRVLLLMFQLDPAGTRAAVAGPGLSSPDSRVRELTVMILGPTLPEFLGDRAETFVRDETDDRVRFRLALGLAQKGTEEHRGLMVSLLDRGATDPWLRIAVCTMKPDPADSLVRALLDHWAARRRVPAGSAELVEQLCDVAASQAAPQPVNALVAQLLAFQIEGTSAEELAEIAWAGLRGIGQASSRRGVDFQSQLRQLTREEQARLQVLRVRATAVVTEAEQPESRRLAVLKTLRFLQDKDATTALLQFVRSEGPIPVKVAALETLSASSDSEIGPALLQGFGRLTPALRRAVLDVLLSNDSRITLLLEAIESGAMAATELDVTRQNRLLKHRTPTIRERAARLFQTSGSADRAAIVAQYQSAVDRRGDPQKGRAVFEKNCVTCHRIDTLGVNVGPDISDTRDKTPAYLLTNILDPNRAVDANYFGYTVVTKQGKILTGLIKSETASSITIRLPEGKEETLLRTDVDEMTSSGLSLMPVGLERTISVEQMSDLVTYLKNWRYLNGAVPLADER